MIEDKKRVIAINLPQFHPFKENDEWWGKGFTEWTNVTKAKPRYRGHYEPHLPSETGFYDLRLPESREMQAAMASEVGVYGFCYYHYWFNGHRLMERPLQEILESKKPDFPFMLCWANENWARNWDGGFSQILIEQKYSKEDDENHMKYLCQSYFCDKRYIRVDNKPVFVVYKPCLHPNMSEAIKIWRKVAKDNGLSLYLIASNSGSKPADKLLSFGFDAVLDFQPVTMRNFTSYKYNPIYAIKYRLNKIGLNLPYLFSYKRYVDYIISQPLNTKDKIYPCVSPGWDNSPRRVGRSFSAFKGSTPQIFEKWLKTIYEKFLPYSPDENFIFINAWNEWAEGNHMEPDIKWGRQYLDVVKKITENNI